MNRQSESCTEFVQGCKTPGTRLSYPQLFQGAKDGGDARVESRYRLLYLIAMEIPAQSSVLAVRILTNAASSNVPVLPRDRPTTLLLDGSWSKFARYSVTACSYSEGVAALMSLPGSNSCNRDCMYLSSLSDIMVWNL